MRMCAEDREQPRWAPVARPEQQTGCEGLGEG